ncbi:MAG: geranylgeranyl reductase family protein [bacterium]
MQVIIAGGGPAGAIAAGKLSANGIRTILFERKLDNDKTCAGGIPSALVKEFDIPDEIIHQKCRNIRFYAPSGFMVELEFPDSGFLATVRRNEFDRYLREWAISRGAIIEEKEVSGYEMSDDGIKVNYKDSGGVHYWAKADYLIGADGAVSRIAKILKKDRLEYVASIQEFIKPNRDGMAHWDGVSELFYSSEISPNYYGWIFPHRDYVALGVGARYEHAKKIEKYLENLKNLNSRWLNGGEVIKRATALLPATQYSEPASDRVFLIGDAAGFVLPGSGEGIYYAMKSGQFAAEAIVGKHLEHHTNPELTYNSKCDREFRQNFNYFRRIEKITFKNDYTREIFVRFCREPGAAVNALSVFSIKKPLRHSNVISKIKRLVTLNKIRIEIKKEGLNLSR